MACVLKIDGTSSPRFGTTIPNTSTDEDNLALTFARTVSPGTHSVEFECQEFDAAAVVVDDAALSVVAVGE